MMKQVFGKDKDGLRDFDENLKLGAVKQFFDILPALGDDTRSQSLSAEVIVRGLATLPYSRYTDLQEVYLDK